MNYDDWLADVPDAIKHDPLWQTAVYRQSLFLGDLAWHDAGKLMNDRSFRYYALRTTDKRQDASC